MVLSESRKPKVQKAQEAKSGLIILDLSMPVITGLDAARELKMLMPRDCTKGLGLSQSSLTLRECRVPASLHTFAPQKAKHYLDTWRCDGSLSRSHFLNKESRKILAPSVSFASAETLTRSFSQHRSMSSMAGWQLNRGRERIYSTLPTWSAAARGHTHLFCANG
jgi:hypothetical protein